MTKVYVSNVYANSQLTFINNQNIISVDCNNIKWINNSMSKAFYKCTSLASINFAGTVNQWNSLSKRNFVKASIGSDTCT